MNLRTWGLAFVTLVGACGDNQQGTPDCDVSGHACTWAGKAGIVGFNGDGLDKLDTELYWTMDMKFAADGSAWFIDWNNHLVRHILTDDTIETLVGWVDPIFPGDGVAGPAEKSIDGVLGTDVKLNHPTDLALLPDGKVLVMAWHNHKLRQIDPVTRHSRILAGGGAGFAGDGGMFNTATFKQPKALERAPDGTLYILDQQNFRVRKIAPSGVISTVAGNGMQGGDGDGGLALEAKLNFEAGSNPEPSGGLALAGSRLFIADTLSNRVRVVDLDTGMIANLAGNGTEGYGGDAGPAEAAMLAHPRDLEIGPEGDLYIADTDNAAVRAVNLQTGQIRTVAGTGEIGLDAEEGMLATKTKLSRPFGIEFDAAGNLYIADTINSRILKVTK
ncbi:MAG: hypothetical protein NT062_30420 [Proteobacteria bacterium]|nr:hypothetical protein [Pseudomonadota bacterium]